MPPHGPWLLSEHPCPSKLRAGAPPSTTWRDVPGRLEYPQELIQAIERYYKQTKNYVRTSNTRSEEFETSRGLRQGCILSPMLFNIVMDEVMKESKHKVKQFQIGYWKLQEIKISEQAYTDDMLIAVNERNLNYNLKIWNESLKNRGLKINIDKTKTMVMAKNGKKHNIKIGKQQREQVERFIYLGVQINQEGRIDEEINIRIA
jgi:hypothetical protein